MFILDLPVAHRSNGTGCVVNQWEPHSMRIAGHAGVGFVVLMLLTGSVIAHNTERVSVSSSGEQA